MGVCVRVLLGGVHGVYVCVVCVRVMCVVCMGVCVCVCWYVWVCVR